MSVDFRQNVDDKIGMNPSRTIGIPRPQINRTRLNNFDIFDLFISPSDLSYRLFEWHGTMKSESENLTGNKIFENVERGNNSKVEKVGHKNSVIWNLKDSGLIRLDTSHTNSNKLLPVK